MDRIYLDNASTTPLDQRVRAAMEPYFDILFGNPGSIHSEGLVAKKALEESRKKIAGVLQASPDEIIFTSGGTESNNLAIFGTIETYKNLFHPSPAEWNTLHIVTTAIEHHSVLAPIKKLEQSGVRVTYLEPDSTGLINPELVKDALTPDTVLVSIMYANNEIGTVEPIAEIAKVIRGWRKDHLNKIPYPLFHSDMCQAPGQLPLDIPKLGVDLASFTAGKMYAPKGAGFLYKRREVLVAPQMMGGTQEKRMRAGTENVSGIVAMSEALLLAEQLREKEVERLTELRDYFVEGLLSSFGVVLNGDSRERLSGNINVSFPDITGEQMVIELDRRGVACATGSACTTDSIGPSHVILSLGSFTAKFEELQKRARGAVRFSLGRSTTKKDLEYVIKCVKEIIAKQAGVMGL